MTSNRQADMRDPVQAAVKVATIETALAGLQSRVSEGFLNVSSRLDSMHADARETARSQAEVSKQLQDLQAHSDGLSRLASAIDRQSLEFAAWREKHEQENRAVADKVTSFNGVLLGFGALGTLVVAGSVAWVTDQFSQIRAEATERTTYQTRDRDRIEGKFDKELIEVRNDIIEMRKLRGVK